jgi:phage baseplate assembly protein W
MADFGTDLSATSGLDPSFSLVSGIRVVEEAAVRRLTTQRGTLFYAPDYGTDVREMLAAKLDTARLSAWRSRIEAELLKDDRVETVRAVLTFTPATESVTVQVAGTTGAGPFAFTLAVTAVSVELLPVG